MEMIYGSNESGKPVLFARLDQQRSCPAFWIVITRTCSDHKAAAQSSATSNINQPSIGSIHVLQRPFVLQMKEQSLFYLSKLAGSVPDQLFETYHADTDCGWDYGSHPQVIQLADCGCEPSRALSIAFRGGQDYVYHSKSPLKFCVV